MSFVTPAHVRQLAEADFSDLPVLVVDIDGEIEVFPQCTATERGATILTDAAALHEYTNGEDLDDVLAEQFAAEINEAYDLVDDTEDTDDTTGEDMRIVNLTPHNVTLVTASGDEVVIQPEATPVRLPAETYPDGEINGIPVVREALGDADSVLPAPQPDTVFVVARPVAERASHRADLVVPTDVERVNGKPVRARALARVMAASPRATAADMVIRVAETAITEDRDRRGAVELLETAAEVRRGSVAEFRGAVRKLSALEKMQFISARLRAETRAALSALKGIESAYKADVRNNPPSCRPCGGTGELPVDDVTPPTPCSECGGTGREVVVPTA